MLHRRRHPFRNSFTDGLLKIDAARWRVFRIFQTIVLPPWDLLSL